MSESSRFTFVIPGVPIPYLRMTQGQVKLMRMPDHLLKPDQLALKARIHRYMAYKDDAARACGHLPYERRPGSKVYLHVVVYFPDFAHGDPENIRKGIQDAIYDQDHYVAGSVDFFYDPDRPRVEVEVVEPADLRRLPPKKPTARKAAAPRSQPGSKAARWQSLPPHVKEVKPVKPRS